MIDVTAASRFIPANPTPAEIEAMTQLLAAAQQPGAHPSPGLSLEKVEIAQGEPLRLEIEAFLHAVRTRTAPEVTAAQGRAALALALEINQTIATHTQRAGLTDL